MSVHEEILGFLDGSLAPDAEAELLHRMSVSPERRALLRSYFKQQSLFSQDRSSIQVPFDAEQGLWAKLDKLMPPVPAVMPAAMTAAPAATALTAASSAGLFGKLTASSAALISSLLLLVGFGSGYFFGNNSTDVTSQLAQAPAAVQAPVQLNNTAQAAEPIIIYRDREPKIIERVVTEFITQYVAIPSEAITLGIAETPASMSSQPDFTSIDERLFDANVYPIPTVDPVIETMEPLKIGEEKNIPLFARMGETEEQVPEKTVLERFEFSFNESFGRQYPNTEATNTTLPLITNSSISTYFQVLPRSEKLWVGFSVGTANVTRKTLNTVHTNMLDPNEEEVNGAYVHVQTNWLGGFLQYRLPMSQRADLTFTSGYGFATAGQMAIGEMGVHYDATKDVGFTVGLRGTRLSYDLKSEMSELMRDRKGSLSVPRGVTDATPSYNLEIATGLFFHF
jgi:hypothetical protein